MPPFGNAFIFIKKNGFLLLGHGLLVATFSFSAIAYSRICRGQTGFVNWNTYLIGIFTTISLFLLVRIFDEFKDAEDDAKYRKELPVPRGLVSLSELKTLGIIVAILQIAVNLYFSPKMLMIYFIVIAYLSLNGKGVFCGGLVKKTSILVCNLAHVYHSLGGYLCLRTRLASGRSFCALWACVFLLCFLYERYRFRGRSQNPNA
jgi:4-hydroxybenzoate polyprenyltransferase